MRQYIVDAFTSEVFSGNPAAVLVLDKWIPDALMFKIAAENNLSETAFAVKEPLKGPKNENVYHLRWISPTSEIDLCGHATLATAFVISNFFEVNEEKTLSNGKHLISFSTRSGLLTVSYFNDVYELDFPAFDLKKVDVTPSIIDALGTEPLEAWLGRDLVCVLKDEDAVKAVIPDLPKVEKLDCLICHVTTKSSTPDFDSFSRTFAPKLGVTEDPVCGSGHCHIAPFWSSRLQKLKLTCYQASKRGGTIICDCSEKNRVKLSGKAVLFSTCEINC